VGVGIPRIACEPLGELTVPCTGSGTGFFAGGCAGTGAVADSARSGSTRTEGVWVVVASGTVAGAVAVVEEVAVVVAVVVVVVAIAGSGSGVTAAARTASATSSTLVRRRPAGGGRSTTAGSSADVVDVREGGWVGSGVSGDEGLGFVVIAVASAANASVTAFVRRSSAGSFSVVPAPEVAAAAAASLLLSLSGSTSKYCFSPISLDNIIAARARPRADALPRILGATLSESARS